MKTYADNRLTPANASLLDFAEDEGFVSVVHSVVTHDRRECRVFQNPSGLALDLSLES